MGGTRNTGVGWIYIYIYIYFFFRKLTGRDFLGDRSSNRMMTLKLVLIEMLCECGDWTKLARSTVQYSGGLV